MTIINDLCIGSFVVSILLLKWARFSIRNYKDICERAMFKDRDIKNLIDIRIGFLYIQYIRLEGK